MKHTAIVFFVLFMFGCQKASSKVDGNTIVQTAQSPQQQIDTKDSEINCEEFFRQIVLSSNITAVKNYKDIFVKIESKSDDKIVLEVFVKNQSESVEKQTIESAVAWLHFFPDTEKLYDITSDPQEPSDVSYNKELLKKYDFRKLCGVTAQKKTENKAANLNKTNCKEITGDMLSGEECTVSNQSLDEVYEEIVNKSLVRDAEFLLKKLPKINTSEKINKNGIIEISYKIKQNQVLIEMLYEGGITNIELNKKNESVIRKIIYNAD